MLTAGITRARASRGWPTACGAAIASTALLLFAAPASAASGTFSNPELIIINDQTTATPYPSAIQVSGLPGTVADVNVDFGSFFDHGFPTDVDILLAGPVGQNVILMSDAGGGAPGGAFDIGFDDEDPDSVPVGPLKGGTYKPTNYVSAPLHGVEPDSFPGVPAPHGNALSVFDGTDPTGQWSLYIVDDTGGDAGTLDAGWRLEIATVDPDSNAPDTEITKGPKSVTKKTQATFTFRSNDPGASFRCAVDGQELKAPCSSPFKVKVSKGKHTFRAQAVDGARQRRPVAGRL